MRVSVSDEQVDGAAFMMMVMTMVLAAMMKAMLRMRLMSYWCTPA